MPAWITENHKRTAYWALVSALMGAAGATRHPAVESAAQPAEPTPAPFADEHSRPVCLTNSSTVGETCAAETQQPTQAVNAGMQAR
jgi:hypothetical protein